MFYIFFTRTPPRAKFVFHNLLYFIEWSGKKLFCKTNLKLKVLKLIKTKHKQLFKKQKNLNFIFTSLFLNYIIS